MKRTTINRILQGLNSHRNTLSITSNHIYVRHSTSSLKPLMKHAAVVPNNNNKLLNHPATTSFGQIRSYTTTNWLKEKEASSNESGESTSAPLSSEPITLNLMDYKKWNAQQVASLMTFDDYLGGAGLSVDDVMSLYEAGFDGSALHNIVEDIMNVDEYFAIDRLDSIYNKNSTPQLSNTCQTVVSWVNERIVSGQQKSQNLLKEIEQARYERAIYFDFERFYSNSQYELATMYPYNVLKHEQFNVFEQILLEKTTIPPAKIMLGYPNFDTQYQSTKLPLVDGSFVKHELPYFTQFQYTMAQEDEVLKLLAPKTKRSTLMFMGPSGTGKTSACVRLLCHNPGMILTCTSPSEATSGLKTDSLMLQAFYYLSSRNIFELFGSVEQVVLMVFICRLIYISKLIHQAKQHPTVFEDFVQRDKDGNIATGGILPYLAYMQSNGKTDTSLEALLYSLKYVYSSPCVLKAFIAKLVNKIIRSLNDNSALFGIVKKIENFIVVIDNANVYSSENTGSNNLSELISLSGEKTGLLTKFGQCIDTIPEFHLSIYSGTNFSIDEGKIMQSSLGKTEAKIDIEKIYDFGLIVRDDIISFLEKHIKIPNNEKKEILFYLHEQGYKYVRRGLITLALEKLAITNNMIDALKLSVDEFVLQAKKNMEPYLDTYNSSLNPRLVVEETTRQGIQDAIVKYVTHYQFPFLGSKFKVHKDDVADALLYSGFSGPESSYWDPTTNYFIFSAKDFIGYEIGLEILKKIFGTEDRSKLTKKIVQERINMLLHEYPNCNMDLESIVMLRLTELDGTKFSETSCWKSLITNHPNLKDHIFKCKHCLDSNGYVEYCISKRVIDPEKKQDENGEELFWTHVAEKKWDLLDGVFISPSKEHHKDVFGINIVTTSTGVIIPMGFQFKVQSGTKFELKPTIDELFYLDNYGILKSNTLYNLNDYHIEETA
ncbi:hypothetical protein C9374_014599 [Naegleria lovaniensis]|uniref:Uncharacterized protein n=1 Tax=Naegleria lovaniensis TaxID=51637 RepID=A0AA88KPJ8_NAELO|nr:uncharacterized protein C9374_014599 [Naegleria lovaniensis]KAG2389199.1 hypothetical protein C9374_014599 [Naegleria lovaniensis]